uniref:Uncharacterized protein n=1 Tax=Coccidioides posadasii RMSCC 3488 TaxID=454284 RepID=A0A0J6FBW4_COCPO|nr:hypothetical protein CPAG_04085 [Coccidioides posadasii RMSCC 3488]
MKSSKTLRQRGRTNPRASIFSAWMASKAAEVRVTAQLLPRKETKDLRYSELSRRSKCISQREKRWIQGITGFSKIRKGNGPVQGRDQAWSFGQTRVTGGESAVEACLYFSYVSRVVRERPKRTEDEDYDDDDDDKKHFPSAADGDDVIRIFLATRSACEPNQRLTTYFLGLVLDCIPGATCSDA